MSESTTNTAGPVNLDDVRAALADTDPTATNAGALRRALGRGSLSTIQRHLDAIRTEQARPALDLVGTAPEMPKELMQGLWAHAWAQAQARTAGALAQALATQEAQAAALATSQADAAAAQAEADAAAEVITKKEAEADATAEAIAQKEKAHTAALEAALEATQAVERTLEQERQARTLEQAQHGAAVAAMRGELDRLVSQLADLRAALGTKAATKRSGAGPAESTHLL